MSHMDLRDEYRQEALDLDFKQFTDAINIQDRRNAQGGPDPDLSPDNYAAASFDRDFEKFNDIQKFNFAELRQEDGLNANEQDGTEHSASQKHVGVGKPPRSHKSNRMSSFRSSSHSRPTSPGAKRANKGAANGTTLNSRRQSIKTNHNEMMAYGDAVDKIPTGTQKIQLQNFIKPSAMTQIAAQNKTSQDIAKQIRKSMALGNSILSSNNLAELEDNFSTLGTSMLLGAGPTGTNFRQQIRNNNQDTLTKNRSFSTLQISMNDRKTKTVKNSQNQLKMVTSATIGHVDANTIDRADKQYMMEQVNNSMPMYQRTRQALAPKASYAAGNYSTLFHKDDALLTKGSFSKYGTIQNPGGFDHLATIAGPAYGARQHDGLSNFLKTNVGIYQRNYGTGA